jgi:nickel/cobalt exporter
MEDLIALQRWLYEGMGSGLRDVASGSGPALAAAMAAAVLFGILHAMMPGHGKTVLFSYHLGQKGSLRSSIANGAILALTHVGIAIVLVLAGFAVISRVFAVGGRTPQFELASGILVVLIGAYLVWRAVLRARPPGDDRGSPRKRAGRWPSSPALCPAH